MASTAALADKLDVRLHTHLGETEDENRYCEEVYGCRPLDYLEQTGWLNRRTWLAHGIHFNGAEMVRLGKAGTTISHCSCSNQLLASGCCPVRDGPSRRPVLPAGRPAAGCWARRSSRPCRAARCAVPCASHVPVRSAQVSGGPPSCSQRFSSSVSPCRRTSSLSLDVVCRKRRRRQSTPWRSRWWSPPRRHRPGSSPPAVRAAAVFAERFIDPRRACAATSISAQATPSGDRWSSMQPAFGHRTLTPRCSRAAARLGACSQGATRDQRRWRGAQRLT